MLPVTVYWLAKYEQVWENTPHTHSFYQMLLTMGGDGTVIIGDAAYSTERGNLLLIPPHVPHTMIGNGGEGKNLPKSIDIKFDVPDENLRQELNALPVCVALWNVEHYRNKLESLLSEAQTHQIYSSEVINFTFTTLLISLIRPDKVEKGGTLDHPAEQTATYKGVDVDRLMQFIDQNFNRIISLDDLSDFAHVNKTTLIHIFRTFYNTTPIKYINRLRMRKAKDLLSNSNISISEISELVGFQSIHYFSRSFKEREGCSPLNWRRKHQLSQFVTIADAAQANEDTDP